ncbi:hypothetical protein AV274_5318 [Blastocystis sp. ATCC 50177/Nand II]|uniref:Uncharacterized protein n=1 Tax=Blastocystis sp. subtype 1 (strain ATCC 50177 / NandII) TaxID=478820 RepID=A0A196S7J5_BLAHN|nr:hypothetical protein AV274_5318 [Blastocystis sp. ATCC 50177/Nand II]
MQQAALRYRHSAYQLGIVSLTHHWIFLRSTVFRDDSASMRSSATAATCTLSGVRVSFAKKRICSLLCANHFLVLSITFPL